MVPRIWFSVSKVCMLARFAGGCKPADGGTSPAQRSLGGRRQPPKAVAPSARLPQGAICPVAAEAACLADRGGECAPAQAARRLPVQTVGADSPTTMWSSSMSIRVMRTRSNNSRHVIVRLVSLRR